MLWAAPCKIGERGASPAAARRQPQPCSRRGWQRRPPGRRAASWRMAQEGERPLTSVYQQHCKDTVVKGAPCEQQWPTRGSPADAYFQHHRHNSQSTWLLSSDSAGSPWSTASWSFPGQKKGMRIRKRNRFIIWRNRGQQEYLFWRHSYP
jgi:hypothetical protein